MSLIKDADGGIRIISMTDVLKHPLYPQLKSESYSVDVEGEKEPREVTGLEVILYTLGMDLKEDIEETFCEHRSELTGVVATCPRFTGRKRKDQAWKDLEYKIRYREI